MAEIAHLFAKISANTSSFERGMRGVNSDLERTSVGMARVHGAAKLITGAAIGLGVAVVGAGAKLIRMGSDAEEMMGKFGTVFGDEADAAIKALDGMAASFGRSRFELRGFAATFQDTFVPLGFARKDASQLSQMLTALTVDLASFNNVAESQAVADLQTTLVGNHEAMRKYGVIITQATLDQELFNMGITGGVMAASEQQKVMARLNIIMAGTADAQGDAMRTADGWANTMRSLKAVITDTATEMGMGLLPIFTPLLQNVRDLAADRLPQLAQGFIAVVSAMAQGVDPLEQLTNGFIALHDVAIVIAGAVAIVALPALVSLISAFAPVIAIFAAAVAAVAALRWAWENDFGGIRTSTEKVWIETIEPFFRALDVWLVTGLPAAIQTAMDKWNEFLAVLETVAKTAEPIIRFLTRPIRMQETEVDRILANISPGGGGGGGGAGGFGPVQGPQPQGFFAGLFRDTESALNKQIPSWITVDNLSGGAAQNTFDYAKALEDATVNIGTFGAGTKTAMDTAIAAFDTLKSKVQGVLSGALQTGVGIDPADFLPRADAINEDARRLADIVVKGFESPWFEFLNNKFPGMFDAVVAGADVKQFAAKLLQGFQDGLDPRFIDVGRAKETVKRLLTGEQNMATMAQQIATELSAELGTAFSRTQIQATAETALGISGPGQGFAQGEALGQGLTSAVSQQMPGSRAMDLVINQIDSREDDLKASGMEAGRWWGGGFVQTVEDNVPLTLLEILTTLITPRVADQLRTQQTAEGAL